jgi:hypothetical protein
MPSGSERIWNTQPTGDANGSIDFDGPPRLTKARPRLDRSGYSSSPGCEPASLRKRVRRGMGALQQQLGRRKFETVTTRVLLLCVYAP